MKYRVHGRAAQFGTDLELVLSEKQYDARASKLDPVVRNEKALKNTYLPNSIVEFKVGEEIVVKCKSTDLPRNLAICLEPVSRNSKK